MGLLQYVGSCIVLLGICLFLPIVKHRVALRIASRGRTCASPPRLPSFDPIFYTDIFIKHIRYQIAHKRIRSLYKMFQKLGVGTYEYYPLGKRSIVTRDPRNVQFILSTEAEKFGNASARELSVPMIGKGIINSDGAEWLKSRKSILPTFTKSHIADREFFDRHFVRFLDRLPRDGRTIDLKPFLDQLAGSLVPAQSWHR